ncbi:DUF6603 domain-containing protein [Streptomyces olivoreticuli]|uniref:DUF6603 domain-containing protein n=1 Tax=Streptomyces olivoreticuli TaxID=68246 RepID=UPI000E28467F|nr:DUF6603 domain-containing protein [Streptomyces olivoreticuli]
MPIPANLRAPAPQRVAHPYTTPLAARDPDNLDNPQPGGVELSRHHIVPCNKLIEFWNRVVDSEYNQSTPTRHKLKEELQRLVGAVLSNCDRYPALRVQAAHFKTFADNFTTSAYTHAAEEPSPDGRDDALSIYEWLPANLLIGPEGAARYDDPHDGFESGCAPITGQQNFNARNNAFKALDRYLKNSDSLQSDGRDFLKKYIQLVHGTQVEPWALRARQWDRHPRRQQYGITGAPVPPAAEAPVPVAADQADERVTINGKVIELTLWYAANGYRRLRGSATDIAVGELIEWIAEQWGVGSEIPEGLRELVMRNLTLEIVTGPDMSDWDFTVATATAFGDIATDLLISLRRRTTGAGGGQHSDFSLSAQAGLTLEVDGETTRIWFEGDFTHTSGSRNAWALRGTWKAEDGGLSLADLGAALGWADAGKLLADLPPTLRPELREVTLAYDSRTGPLIAATVGPLTVVFAPVRDTTGLVWCVQVRATVDAGLTDLPLLRGAVPKEADLRLAAVRVVYTSAPVKKTLLDALNEVVAAARLPLFPAVDGVGGLPRGGVLCVDYTLPGHVEDTLTVPLGQPSGSRLPASRAASGSSGAGAWVDIGRNIGPLTVYRIGLVHEHNTLWMGVDGALTAAGFTLSVAGLALGIGLTDGALPVQVRLDGLGVQFVRPPLKIAGALVDRRRPGYDLMVQGGLTVEMPTFGVLALGAYQRRTGGETSMFVFGRATAAFGGPPPFQVTGVALGFGYNSSVRVPGQDEIGTFPFVSGLDDGLPDDPMEALAKLTDGPHPWVTAREGQIWLAGGLDFTSFEFVRARVLLLLEAGADLTVALLGHATASFPKKGAKKYARVGVDLRIVYQSARGELAATAQLVDSYVIDPSCVLTGGFAFCSWFGPSPHAGNFVLTVGGYHPDYETSRPDYFPVVPRLGFTWSVGSAVTVSGGAYFALTPNAVMAGGSLDVRYKAGNVEAWLTAQADLLIQWAPLHFRAGISVRVGARVKLLFTISGEIGASLDLWGPPTGGTVTAKFVFIKVTVKFGAPLSGPAALDWDEFRTQLLPPEAPLTAHPLTGLRTDSDADHALRAARIKAGEEPWLADPAGFSFAVSTVVPTARAQFNDRDPEGGSTVDIRPMKKKGIDGLLQVTVDYSDTRHGQLASWRTLPDEDRWRIGTEHGNVPFALWGDPDVPQDKTLGEDPLLDHLTGLRVTVPPPRTKGQDLGPIAEGDLAREKLHPDATLPLDPDAGPTGSPVELAHPLGAGVGVLAGQIASLSAGSARTRMHGVLAGLCPEIPLSNGTVGDHAEQARTTGLDADPLLLTQDPAPPTPGPVVLVLDDTTGAILSVDPETATVVGRVPLGQPGPYLAVTSADGATLYAAGANPRQLEVIDVVAQQVRAPRTGIQLTGRPTVLAVKRDGSRAVVARPDRVAAASIDPAGVAEPVHTDVDRQDVQAFGGIAVDVEAGLLYVNANDASKTVTYDTSTGSKLGTVHGPATPTSVTPGEPGRVYVYGAEASSNGQVQLVTVPTPGDWYQPYNFPGSGRGLALLTNSARRGVMLRATGDGGQVVTLYERHGSTKDTVAESNVSIGPAPRALALDPADRAWVLHTAAVSVVSNGSLLGELALGAAPLSATFAPDATRAFVACADASVAVVELRDNAPVQTERWPLPADTVASAALYTVFTDHSSEGAAR